MVKGILGACLVVDLFLSFACAGDGKQFIEPFAICESQTMEAGKPITQLLRLVLPSDVHAGAQSEVVVCGGSFALGNWRPESALRMKLVQGGQRQAFEAHITVEPETEFKYVILSDVPRWEDSRPNRKFRSGATTPHVFDRLEPWEEIADGAVQVSLKLKMPDSDTLSGGAHVVVCGESPALGQWNPLNAPQMRVVDEQGGKHLEADVIARPGTPFKFVILRKGALEAKWEDRPNRVLGNASLQIPCTFDGADPNEELAAGAVEQILELEIPTEMGDGDHVVVCGESMGLGQWQPDRAPKMQSAAGDGRVLSADVIAKPGTPFKFVILRKGSSGVQWEDRPNRIFGNASARSACVFNGADLSEELAAGAVPKVLKLEMPPGISDGDTVVVCGESLGLGQWQTDRAPKMQVVASEDDRVLSADVMAKPGTPFKFVIISKDGEKRWEDRSLNRNFGSSSLGTVHHFGQLDAEEQERHRSVPLTLQLSLPPDVQQPDSVVVCGGWPSLGDWTVSRAPHMTLESDGRSLKAEVAAPLGTEFKYVLLASGEVEWEERPNRVFGDGPAVPHHFSDRESFEELEKTILTEEVPATSVEVDLSGHRADAWIQIPWASASSLPPSGNGFTPRTIYHAFDLHFSDITKKLDELRNLGFDAVQISPAQKSKKGKQWWTRYQPQDYLTIEGLGSVTELEELCQGAASRGMIVVADIVFNHMLVVANANEWERAQRNPTLLQELKQRLTDAVAPHLDAADFQWPWFKMEGKSWDNEERYEGWGMGEWSELSDSPKVNRVHQEHLRILLDAGVRGFRFDAVKHMRLEHLQKYISFLRSSGHDIYVYGEVLSESIRMHHEYMDPLKMPTTDFTLFAWMKEVTKGTKTPQSNCAAPMLSNDSVRFAVNHDTLNNDWEMPLSLAMYRAIWIWVLAVHDGTVLVYSDSIEKGTSADLLKRAVRFRRRTASAISSDVRILGSPSQLLSVVVRGAEGQIEGICLANLREANLRVGSALVADSGEGRTAVVMDDASGSIFHLQRDGSLAGAADQPGQGLVIPPMDAAFFFAAPSAQL